MAEPWFKFYPTDWRADPALQMCSLAARGLWIEMLGFMHDAAQYGHLLIANLPPSDADLAKLIGSSPEQISELLGELEARAVFSRTRKGVIYSRKMVRDAKKAETARKNGKKGGNPTLSNKRGNHPSDNPRDKGRDKPQKPEARSQIIHDDDDSARTPDRPTLRERILVAIGADPVTGLTGPNCNPLGNRHDMDEVSRWQALGLTDDQIVEVVTETMAKKRDGPPDRFTYFEKPMRQEAGRKTRPALTPIEGGYDVQPTRPSREAAASDALRNALDVAGKMRRPSSKDCF